MENGERSVKWLGGIQTQPQSLICIWNSDWSRFPSFCDITDPDLSGAFTAAWKRETWSKSDNLRKQRCLQMRGKRDGWGCFCELTCAHVCARVCVWGGGRPPWPSQRKQLFPSRRRSPHCPCNGAPLSIDCPPAQPSDPPPPGLQMSMGVGGGIFLGSARAGCLLDLWRSERSSHPNLFPSEDTCTPRAHSCPCTFPPCNRRTTVSFKLLVLLSQRWR